ncbi:MAG: Hint domain-containing protein [Acidocella sp.]|nr:Hint domain-containing protein [Acidocella sp.]
MAETINTSLSAVVTLTSRYATITSSGSVYGFGTITGYGINAALFAPTSLGTITIHNAGVINAIGSQAVGPLDFGIALAQPGTIINTGRINGNSGIGILGSVGSSYIENNNLIISQYGVGIYLQGSGTIVNNSNIIDYNSGAGLGIELKNGGLISNTSTGVINADNTGIYLDNGGTVINAGNIHGTKVGIVNKTGSETIINSGNISGATTGIALLTGGTVTNSGNISGASTADAITFASGFANRLILQTGAHFSGLVDGGNSFGSTASSVLELTPGSSNYLSGLGTEFINFSTIAVDATANWTLGNNNTLSAGQVLDNAGSLTIDGILLNNGYIQTDPTTMVVNAAVYGSGTIGIVSGSSVIFNSSVGPNQVIDLLSPNATLSDNPALFSGKIIIGFVDTLTSSPTTIVSTETIIASGAVGTYFVNNGGTQTPQIINAAVFGPNSLTAPTLLNQGFIDANGPATLGGFDVGILLGNSGSIFNTGSIIGHTAIGMLGTSGSNYIYNNKLILGTQGVGIYIHNLGSIVNSSLIASYNTTSANGYSGIELGGGGFISNRDIGTIVSNSGSAVNLQAAGTIQNAGHIIGYQAGIALNGGGSVANTGTIEASGLQKTQQSYIGIYASHGASITNNGIISGPVGIKILGTIGEAGYVLNTQLITASSTLLPGSNFQTGFVNYGVGVYINVAGSVANNGTIVGNHAGVAFNNVNGGSGTISNKGGSLISSAGYGVILEAGGSVNNTGLISGYRTGIRADNAITTIVNAGIILGTGNTFADNGTLSAKNLGTGTYISHGIMLTSGGSIINETTSTISAVQGVVISGAGNGYVNNAGLINATNRSGIDLKDHGTINNLGTVFASHAGVQLYNGGYVKNSGQITSLNRVGIYLYNNGYVTNSGTINANYAGIYSRNGGYNPTYIRNTGHITSATKSGVYLKVSGQVYNAGIINAPAGAGVFMAKGKVTNGSPGTITGANGVVLKTANMTNHGLVDGTAGSGIYLQGLGTVLNSATARAIGSKYGVELGGANSYLGNSGTAAGSIGVYIKAGGYLTNHGTATGNIGVYAKAGGVINDFGVISGTADAVKFGATSGGKLIINPGASFIGTVEGGGKATMELGGTSAATLTGLGTQFIDFATIKVDAGSRWTLTGNNTIAIGQTLSDFATLIVNGTFTDNGVVNADPSTIVYESAVTGTGTIDIAAGSTVVFDASVASSITIDFLSSTGTIVENAPALFGNPTIIGTGVIIIACFAKGTRILTPQGEVAVENLRAGDMVITAEGEDAPIKWIGTRNLDLRRHAHPEKAQPVRISAGAISHNVPNRDLFLSPDHALYLQGHLVPAKALINRMSVTQENWQSVSYYHIELDHHAVIFAAETPVETYLETGNRHCFENAGEPMALHPDFGQDFQALREAKSCAPFLDDNGPTIRGIRTAMLDRAYWNTPRRAANQ